MRSKWFGWALAICFLGEVALLFAQRLRRSSAVPAAAPSTKPPEPTVVWGGYGIVLHHTGKALKQEDWIEPEATFDVVGIGAEPSLDVDSPELKASVLEPLLDPTKSPRNPRVLEILARDGLTWRLQLEVLVDERDQTPHLERLIGRPLQLHVERFRFGVGSFAALRLADSDGLVVALDFRSFSPGEDKDIAVDTGATLGTSTGPCGTDEIKTMVLTADAQLSVRPGEHASLGIHDRKYTAWNLASSMLTNDQLCTDMFSDFAWFVEREAD